MIGRHIRAGIVGLAAVAAAMPAARAVAQPLDLSVVNESNDWAAGCGTDESGTDFCAVQKSRGAQALGYVMLQRDDGVARQIRIAVDSIFIDAESPVTIQIDENEPVVWPTGYEVIDSHVLSLDGQEIRTLLRELETGESVVVTVVQKTGEPLTFELALDGFYDAIAALEEAHLGQTE